MSPPLQRVVVGHVRREAPDLVRASGARQHVGVDLRDLGAVPRPPEPARVGRVQVQPHVRHRQALDREGDRPAVDAVRRRALRDARVRGDVGQRVRFEDDRDSLRGVRPQLGRERFDELGRVPRLSVGGGRELAARRAGGAIPLREVVDHQDRRHRLPSPRLARERVVERMRDAPQRRDRVEPDCRRHRLELAELPRPRGRAAGRGLDLGCVGGVGIEVRALERVALRRRLRRREGDGAGWLGWRARTSRRRTARGHYETVESRHDYPWAAEQVARCSALVSGAAPDGSPSSRSVSREPRRKVLTEEARP